MPCVGQPRPVSVLSSGHEGFVVVLSSHAGESITVVCLFQGFLVLYRSANTWYLADLVAALKTGGRQSNHL